jgi:hypothetical protein
MSSDEVVLLLKNQRSPCGAGSASAFIRLST